MESSPFPRPTTPFTTPLFSSRRNPISLFPIPHTKSSLHARLFPPQPVSALKSPKGFGPSPNKTSKKQKKRGNDGGGGEDEEEEGNDDYVRSDGGDDTIPEVVTNRMMKRMGFSVGIPLVIGLMFFPFFYYLKVVAKVDIPTWLPVIVSFVFFGTALLGVSYGIVSSSWDPLREGSILGWNEAQKNWPVFWQSLWGRKGNN
ncbi:protein PAM68, chloroplastic [Magnolia sinica]|uniref:protein PAM68, chloroplastic n=1 Tax=Magnolia sinica TaxID=86752 RepID=UPI00265A585D|nr:protein PAM68, chloroplastic [Magnolia sinica]